MIHTRIKLWLNREWQTSLNFLRCFGVFWGYSPKNLVISLTTLIISLIFCRYSNCYLITDNNCYFEISLTILQWLKPLRVNLNVIIKFWTFLDKIYNIKASLVHLQEFWTFLRNKILCIYLTFVWKVWPFFGNY